MPSAEYTRLEAEIEALRLALADRIDPLGNYSEAEKRRTLAFLVLSHACMEHFVEERCREVLRAARADLNSGHTHPSVPSLLAFSGRGDLLAPTAPPSRRLEEWRQNHDLTTRVSAVIATLEKTVSDNHGLKESNLVSLLIPLGIRPSDLDQTLVASLNSFGSDRGFAAHVIDRVFRDAIDAGTEVTRVKQLVQLLGKLDAQLEALVPTHAPSSAAFSTP
jgi:hypothetical protein